MVKGGERGREGRRDTRDISLVFKAGLPVCPQESTVSSLVLKSPDLLFGPVFPMVRGRGDGEREWGWGWGGIPSVSPDVWLAWKLTTF